MKYWFHAVESSRMLATTLSPLILPVFVIHTAIGRKKRKKKLKSYALCMCVLALAFLRSHCNRSVVRRRCPVGSKGRPLT